MANNNPNLDEDLGFLTSLAERMGLKDDDADTFIGEAMSRLGYKAKRTWDLGEEGQQGRGNGFFGGGGQRSTRSAGPNGRGSGFGQYR